MTTWMTKEKGEHRCSGRAGYKFLVHKSWIFLPWKGCKPRWRPDLPTAPAAGREGKELLFKDGVQACHPNIWHTAMASEGSCTGRGGWGLFHYSWHPAVLSNWLLCLSPGTVLGDTKKGYPQSIMKERFFFKHHAFENHLNPFHIIKLVCELVWKFQNRS